MKTQYETGKGLKFTEEDIYQDGCNPDTAQSWEVDITFQAETVQELINKIMEYFDVPKKNLELNSCEEKGRIDISLLEDENSDKATKEQINLWQKNQIKLWNSIYSFQVYKVTRETIEL